MSLLTERYVTGNTGSEAAPNQGSHLWKNGETNMRMTENEKQRIVKSADFLYDKGYTSKIKDYAISFLGDGISFIVSYERYSDTSDVLIKFMKENEVYSVGWIACVRSGLNIQPHLRLENVLMLLSYIRENYSSVTSRNYCKESDKSVSKFIENHKNPAHASRD